jgi:hypothetical protein
MYNYIRTFLFFLLIILTPHMNMASKAMDAKDDVGHNGYTSKMSFKHEEKENSSLEKRSTPAPVVSLEDTQTSWTSYLLSPAKSVVQGAYDIINFTTQKPRTALVIGLVLSLQVTTTAANCTCLCWDKFAPRPHPFSFFGIQRDAAKCSNVCMEAFEVWSHKCIPW